MKCAMKNDYFKRLIRAFFLFAGEISNLIFVQSNQMTTSYFIRTKS